VASIPTHFVVGAALGQAAGPRLRSDWRFWTVAIVCSALPDVDVIGFGFGVRYGDVWGHRGMTHSILFALAIGLAAGFFFGGSWAARVGQSLLFFAITISHGLLDAMTNGGLGIAFFSPFDPTRYFFSWRPILVSPIGVGFFSERGAAVLQSELLWVWPAALALGLALYTLRRAVEARAEQ
jgi:inner membrane protein